MLHINKHLDGDEPTGIKKVSDTDDVKKLNKNPIVIISVVVIAFVLGILYVAGTRTESVKIEGAAEIKESSGEASHASILDSLQGQATDSNNSAMGGINSPFVAQNGSIPPSPTNGDPLADPFAQNNATNRNGQITIPPLPQDGSVQKPPNPFEELRKQEAMKRLKLGYSALEGSPKTGLATMSQNTQNQGTGQQFTPQQQQLKIMDGYVDKIMGMGAVNGTTGVTDNSGANKQFMGETPIYDYVAGKKTAQLNPFELKTGTVIPAVLITGVNSELPGKMKAQISENVYDTATGKYLLIPQGSTLVGDYSSGVVYGQKRVLTAWNRIIFPDGKTLNIGNMGGTDKEGFSGFQDEVDNHYMRIFGSAFMMGAITGGIVYATPPPNPNATVQTPSDQMIAGMVAQLGQVGIQMIQKNMNIAPTLTIRAGYKFNIFVTKDMRLEPLKMKLR